MFAVLPTRRGQSLIFQLVTRVCSYLHDRGFSYPKDAIVVVICLLIDSNILELKENPKGYFQNETRNMRMGTGNEVRGTGKRNGESL